MDRARVIKVVFSVGCVALGSTAVLAQSGDHATFSSDGSQPSLTVGGGASASFAGAPRPGAALDATAEFPALRLNTEELAAFSRRFKPKLPPYAPRGAGMAQPESVLGADRRFRVYPRESGFPYRAIGLLTFSQGGGDFVCTGWLIGKDTVATAGHCVHEGGGGTWSRDVRLFPAFNAGTAPFGSCSARRLYTVVRWAQGSFEDGSEEFDYGAVKLNCEIGRTTGWLGYYATTESQVGLPVLLMGYPGDRTPLYSLWRSSGGIVASERRKTRYQLDTGGGQSGSPVIEADRGASRAHCFGTCAVAIHAYGEDDDGNNSGTRINYAVADNLTAWKNAP